MAIKISGTTVIDDSRDINNIGVITATGDIISSGNLGIGTITPTGTAALTNNEATLAVGIVTTNTVYGTTKIIAKQFSAHNPDGTNVATRDKYRLWDSSVYNIGMDNDMSFGGLNDYAMTFQMNSDDDRGFWWGDNSHSDAQGAMTLNTIGELVVAKSIRAGGGESDTSAPAQPLDIVGDGTISGTLTVGTAITARAGIITADIIHLTGGTFGPIDGGTDTKADTAIVVGENFHIYNVESSGGHLRNLIEKNSGDITIGQSNTTTINKISLIPGKGDGRITELWAGNASASVGILTANASGVEVSGILTATTIKGPGTTDAAFFGDGSGLSNVTGTGSGIVIRHDNTLVGTAATIDISTNLDVTAVSAGVCTISAAGGGGINAVVAAMVFG